LALNLRHDILKLVDEKIKFLWNVDAVYFDKWLGRLHNCFVPKMQVAIHSELLVPVCRTRRRDNYFKQQWL